MIYAWRLTTTATDFDGNILNQIEETDELVAEIVRSPRPIEGISDPIEVRYYRSASPDTFGVNWFEQDGDNLREVAFENAGIIPRTTLKRATKKYHPVELSLLAGPNAYTQAFIDPTPREEVRIVFPYPLDVGDNWVSFNTPFLQVREVISRDTIQSAAGEFVVFRMTTESPDIDGFAGWTDLVSSEGLIERIYLTETPLRDAQGAPLGTQTVEERLSLTDIERP